MSLSFWKSLSPKGKRIMSIIIFFIFALVVTIAGTLTPISEQEATRINNELNQSVNSLKTNSMLLQAIFGNNFMITLILFVPILGPMFGILVLYDTGVAIAATATVLHLPPTLTFLLLFLTPVAWLEFIVYSTALAESVWLIRRILQRKGKHELVNTTKFISICAVILFTAAVIETILIM